MSQDEWLHAELTLEEELSMERITRGIWHENDIEKVRDVCASLYRANWRHRKLLVNAVQRIAQLEAKALGDYVLPGTPPEAPNSNPGQP